MKNIFVAIHRQEILDRIHALKPDAKPQWGKMNVNQSLRHMAMGFDIAPGVLDPTPAKVPPIPKWLMKFFLLSMKPPKGSAPTFKEMDMVDNNINPSDFEAEQKNLVAAIERIIKAESLVPENKIAGKFSKDDWGKLNYNHCDHHLRQFGG